MEDLCVHWKKIKIRFWENIEKNFFLDQTLFICWKYALCAFNQFLPTGKLNQISSHERRSKFCQNPPQPKKTKKFTPRTLWNCLWILIWFPPNHIRSVGYLTENHECKFFENSSRYCHYSLYLLWINEIKLLVHKAQLAR